MGDLSLWGFCKPWSLFGTWLLFVWASHHIGQKGGGGRGGALGNPGFFWVGPPQDWKKGGGGWVGELWDIHDYSEDHFF